MELIFHLHRIFAPTYHFYFEFSYRKFVEEPTPEPEPVVEEPTPEPEPEPVVEEPTPEPEPEPVVEEPKPEQDLEPALEPQPEKKPELLFCPECGSKLREGSKFCSSCGTKLF